MRARRGFTLIELLVIIGIMGAMVTVSVVSVRAGQGAARVRGAARDIFAVIRHARSTALVTQKPAIITYSTEEEDGEVVARVEVDSAKLMDSSVDLGEVQTLTGAPVGGDGDWRDTARLLAREARGGGGSSAGRTARGGDSADEDGSLTATKSALSKKKAKGGDAESSENASGGNGQTVDDILFAPISSDVVKGMRLKVEKGESVSASGSATRTRSKVSVFSNVDYLLDRFSSSKKKSSSEEDESGSKSSKSKSSKDKSLKEERQEPVRIVWEANGRVEPHRVWIYADGSEPEKGLCVKIDRFGAAKVVPGDERE